MLPPSLACQRPPCFKFSNRGALRALKHGGCTRARGLAWVAVHPQGPRLGYVGGLGSPPCPRHSVALHVAPGRVREVGRAACHLRGSKF